MGESLQFKDKLSEPLQATAAKDSKVAWLLVLVGLCVIYLASILYTPAPAKPNGNYFTLCGFKNLTGLPCPGCGLTHSFCAIGKGELGTAFAYNLLGPPLFLLSLLVAIKAVCVIADWRGPVRALDSFSARFNLIRATVTAFLVFGVARILYLLLTHTASVEDSPLARWLARIAG